MTLALIISFLLAVLKIAVTCIPSDGVDWILNKFSLHQKLSIENVTVTYKDKQLNEAEKTKLTEYFNEAMFLKKYFIFPGNEELFLYPESGVTPLVINEVKGKKNIMIYVYRYNDRIDVVKQSKKKVIAYSLRSDNLQQMNQSHKVLNIRTI